MLQKQESLSSTDFEKGLVTRSDILKSDPNQSPNTMNMKWNFDGSIQKRLGSTTTNSVVISSGGLGGFIVQDSLTNNLVAYWKMDEASGTRLDSFSDFNLNQVGNPLNATGIRGNSVDFVRANSQMLYMNTAPFAINGSSFTVASWIYMASTGSERLVLRQNNTQNQSAWEVAIKAEGRAVFRVLTDGGSIYAEAEATSAGLLQVGSFYNIVSWISNGLHVGISVNLSVDTSLFVGSVTDSGLKTFTVGAQSNGAEVINQIDSRIDEVSIWNRGLSLTERQQLYAGGSGNTFVPDTDSSSWASFDFGASSLRWLTVSLGTGIFASSNGGTSFVAIASTRTLTYQYLERSRNVLIATSDAYDVPLSWAGSAGTFASTLAPNSAPSVKYSINYQGFLILLNSSTRKRGFFYADEDTQLTDPWTNSFDIPSSNDDEITASFILGTFLYVSTRYRIYRVSYVGGNPDWKYLKVKDWGFVPRTVKLATLKKETTQVAIGIDWNKRLRVFDGYNDLIVSDNIENYNGICEFATSRISSQGSGLLVSYSEIDSNEQEYRLGVAIGAGSTQATHHICLNLRTLAFFPYSNQNFNTMVMSESNNILRLMAFDRSGYCHILNSGNLDVTASINEVYDSPLLYKNIPSQVSKSKQLNLYFSITSSGTIYSRERADMSNVWSEMRPLRDSKGNSEFLSSESSLQLQRSIDVTSVQNTYQFQITSSSNTASPWKMTHFDYLQAGLGFGKGG